MVLGHSGSIIVKVGGEIKSVACQEGICCIRIFKWIRNTDSRQFLEKNTVLARGNRYFSEKHVTWSRCLKIADSMGLLHERDTAN